MGGMAIGSAVTAHPLVARRDPILTFAALEALIGLYALLSPTLLVAIGGVGGQELRFFLALMSLLPATVAMGASLPILVRAFGHHQVAIGLGQLYAANSAGAVLGPLLAVFWFFPSVGLTATVWVGAGLDFLVAATLVVAHRRFIGDTPAEGIAEPVANSAVSADSPDSAGSSVPWPLLAARAPWCTRSPGDERFQWSTVRRCTAFPSCCPRFC